MSRVFASSPGDQSSIPGRVIPKSPKKVVLDATFHKTQPFKVKIKGKVEQSMEWSSTLPYSSNSLLKRELSDLLRLRAPTY